MYVSEQLLESCFSVEIINNTSGWPEMYTFHTASQCINRGQGDIHRHVPHIAMETVRWHRLEQCCENQIIYLPSPSIWPLTRP